MKAILFAAMVFTLTALLTQVAQAGFANGGFESGALNQPPPSWTVNTFSNSSGVTLQSPQTLAGLNLAAGGVAKTFTLYSAGGPNSQSDPSMGATASLRYPRYGTNCAIVNQLGINKNVNSLSQTMTVGAGDVDPDDGQVHVRFVYAPVMQVDVHPSNQESYGFIQLVNVTQGSLVLFTQFFWVNEPGIPFKTASVGTSQYAYTDWQLVDIAPGSPGINLGDILKLQFIASGCQPGGHWAEMYVDGVGATIPGISLEGTAPVGVVSGSTLTYNLHYKNGAAGARSGVQINFTTPPNTTFASISAPADAFAITPVVGTAGLVSITFFNALPAGASDDFSVTVAVNAGTALGSTITQNNYSISSTQEPPLLGPPILTLVQSVAAPVVTTLAASNITGTGAMLNGSVNPGNGATAAYFRYGTTTNYGSFTATNSLAATNSTLSVSNLIGGLSPATTYHCQLVGTNSAGTNFGADMTFTTSAIQPVSFSLSSVSKVIGGVFQFGFSNVSGAGFTVFGTTNLAWPFNAWSNLGPAVETPASSGHYQFTDSQATNSMQRFYRVTSP